MILVSAFLILYSLHIAALCFGFSRLKYNTPKNLSGRRTSFSIIIPFRNEASNLKTLLESLSDLNYIESHFEIVLVDDDSTDESVAIIEAFQRTSTIQISVLKNERVSGSPKKDALTIGISKAQFDWIVTTDADCKVPQLWLTQYDQKIRTRSCSFIAGPVTYFESKGFFSVFQQLDFLSLQGATLGSFGLQKGFMCNGANLAFSKAEFLKLNGYAETDHLASGDDVFLMQKFIKEMPEKVHYLKTEEALVLTQNQTNWRSLLNQRRRWAAKASAYKSWFAILTALLVLGGNFAFIMVIFYPRSAPLLLLKIGVDFILLYQTATLFNQKKVLRYFLPAAIIYPVFTVYVALASQFGEFNWKGRTFKK